MLLCFCMCVYLCTCRRARADRTDALGTGGNTHSPRIRTRTHTWDTAPAAARVRTRGSMTADCAALLGRHAQLCACPHAQDFGICARILKSPPAPVLGVCLGCQGLGWMYGLDVCKAPGGAVHGRKSAVFHNEAERGGGGLFAGIPDGFHVVRYHSLAVVPRPGLSCRQNVFSFCGKCLECVR